MNYELWCSETVIRFSENEHITHTEKRGSAIVSTENNHIIHLIYVSNMRNLLNPRWLLLLNTLPIAVLFVIEYGEFSIIKSLLKPENLAVWSLFSLVLGALFVANLAYTLYAIRQKQYISPIYSGLAFFTYTAYLYVYCYNSNDIMPFSIPQWMVSDNICIYVGTFLMPTIAHAFFAIVAFFTPEERAHKAWHNFAFALAVPILWYLCSMVILPLYKMTNPGVHLIVMIGVSGALAFLFFLVRGIYIISMNKGEFWEEYKLAIYFFIALVCPVLGLVVNKTMGGIQNDSGIFGDFNTFWFYALAIINGLLLCIPQPEKPAQHLALFIGRSVMFGYTLYFFLVFLPYLPFSVVAILGIGIGFLMLTPLVLFVIHSRELNHDFSVLQANFTKKTLIILFFGSVSVLPLCIMATYWHDKSVLAQALAYLYTPDYSKTYDLDEQSIAKTLNIVKSHKQDRWSIGSKTPYLSALYTWIVLDNMTLSDTKIRRMENVFLGHKYAAAQANRNRNDWDFNNQNNTKNNELSNNITIEQPAAVTEKAVQISNIGVSTTFDSTQNAYKTWINLEITNPLDYNALEYNSIFELPQGCFISDYYLYVNDKKEMGILAEKKAAMWVFNQIVNTNRDPGILHYGSGNEIVFKVFPFSKYETRKTGFEIVHKDAFELNLSGTKIKVDIPTTNTSILSENKPENVGKNIVFVSKAAKTQLPTVERTPYYHFIIDISDKTNIDNIKKQYIAKIERFLSNQNPKLNLKNAQISFTNTYTTTLPFGENWQTTFNNQSFKGGFYAERAIKQTLFAAYAKPKMSYPLLILITDDLNNAIIEGNFSDFAKAYPENNSFYNMNEDGSLNAYDFTNNHNLGTYNIATQNPKVLAFPNATNPIAYLKIDDKPSIILKNTTESTDNQVLNPKSWAAGLAMQGEWLSQILHPETADDAWLTLVKHSFESKILTPVTAYMVVENEAQKAVLAKKQAQVLSGNKSLDLSDDAQRMSEPSVWLLVLLLGLYFGYKKRGTHLAKAE